MPRALTEQEKCRLCKRLLEKGKAIVLSQGIKKVSVDDIAKAAGMAKGSFYQHFESKEVFLYELIDDIHMQIFEQAQQMIKGGGNDLRENTRTFLMNLFHMPQMVFFSKNYHEINELFESMPEKEALSAQQMEKDMFEKLLLMAGLDTQKVKPGVVSNYIHALYLIMGSELMIEDDLSETFDHIMDNLISYIFGGAK
ncbi:MAG: TetR/AcrR family transcriptional regulator [Treponema sp.]|nr:TetR/AcrR family transcriptional regulator [Treponema sp.]